MFFLALPTCVPLIHVGWRTFGAYEHVQEEWFVCLRCWMLVWAGAVCGCCLGVLRVDVLRAGTPSDDERVSDGVVGRQDGCFASREQGGGSSSHDNCPGQVGDESVVKDGLAKEDARRCCCPRRLAGGCCQMGRRKKSLGAESGLAEEGQGALESAHHFSDCVVC